MALEVTQSLGLSAHINLKASRHSIGGVNNFRLLVPVQTLNLRKPIVFGSKSHGDKFGQTYPSSLGENYLFCIYRRQCRFT